MTRILFYASAVMMVVICLMFARISHLEHKVEQGKEFESLYKGAMHEAKVWKDKHNQWHSRAEDLAVSNSTLKEMVKAKDPDVVRLLSEVKDLRKNLSNLQSFNVTATHTETQFNVRLKDTTIVIGDTVYKAKEFNYATKWDKYKGIIENDSVFLIREGTDTLDIAVSWSRKWFLAKKKYSSEVVSGNPDTKITYNRALTLKRKRK